MTGWRWKTLRTSTSGSAAISCWIASGSWPGQVADVQVDHAAVRHLVERVAAHDAAEVHRRRGNSSDDSCANPICSIRRKPCERLQHGVVALPRGRAVRRAALEHEAQRQHALRLHADLHVGRLAGDREVADVAVLDEPVRAAVSVSSDSSSATQTKWTRTSLRSRHLAERAHHRREPALHVVGAAAEQAVAVDARLELLRSRPAPRRGGRGGRSWARSRRRPSRPAPGRPLYTVPSTSMSRASSQPLMKPAAACMPSRVEVS